MARLQSRDLYTSKRNCHGLAKTAVDIYRKNTDSYDKFSFFHDQRSRKQKVVVYRLLLQSTLGVVLEGLRVDRLKISKTCNPLKYMRLDSIKDIFCVLINQNKRRIRIPNTTEIVFLLFFECNTISRYSRRVIARAPFLFYNVSRSKLRLSLT